MDDLMTIILNSIELLILVATVVATIWIYNNQKTTERKHAASIIVMQIDSINKNTDLVMHVLGNDVKKFDIAGFWKSEAIIENNLWEEYRHLFAKKLKYDQIVSLNNFYENALSAVTQQNEIKMLISEINKSFYIDISKLNKDDHEKALKSENPYISCSTIYLETMYEKCRMIVKNKDAIPYQTLRKIAKI